jgi:3-isopropylmalate/(R)-2-methylmalate dehydratase small subunit
MMQPFIRHTGVAAPLLRINVDTDAIIPSREMRSVSKKGLSAGLFAGWRYSDADARTPNPEFVLNKPEYSTASIILAGANFGCGSSREHAVWALVEYGIRCIIAPSFGAIFYNNCVRNGLLPIALAETSVKMLARCIEQNPQQYPLTIDLQQRTIRSGDRVDLPFEIEASHRLMLLEGLDAIGLTLKSGAVIQDFIARDRVRRPWVYR